jgi:hypothetical protein
MHLGIFSVLVYYTYREKSGNPAATIFAFPLHSMHFSLPNQLNQSICSSRHWIYLNHLCAQTRRQLQSGFETKAKAKIFDQRDPNPRSSK